MTYGDWVYLYRKSSARSPSPSDWSGIGGRELGFYHRFEHDDNGEEMAAEERGGGRDRGGAGDVKQWRGHHYLIDCQFTMGGGSGGTVLS
jgi:hypothetical protein